MADGSIKIDTKIDNKGAKAGIKKLGGSLKSFGKATGKVLAAGAAGAAAMATGFIVAAKNTAAFGDNVDKMSQKLNISREGFQKWDFVLSQNGANINSLGVGMKTLQQKMDDANAGSKKSVELFSRLGISMDEVRNSSPEEMFEKTVEQLQKMPSGAEKSALAFQAFGKQGQELAPLLNQSAEATEELKQKAVDMGMVMSDEAIDATANFTDSLDILGRTLTGAKNKMAGEFLPALTKVTDGLSKILTGDESGLAQIDEGIKEFVDKFNALLPIVLDMGGRIIKSLVKAIIEHLPDLITQAGKMVLAIVSGIILALPEMVAAAIPIIEALVTGLIKQLPQLAAAAVEIVGTLADEISKQFPLLSPFADVVKILADNFDIVLAVLVPLTAAFVAYKAAMAISGIITSATKATKGMTLSQYALNLAMSLNPIAIVTAALAALAVGIIYLWNTNDKFKDALILAWTYLKDFFTKAIPEAFNKVIDFVKGNWQGLLLLIVAPFAGAIKLLYDLNPKFKGWVDNLLTSFGEWIKGFVDIGKNIVRGIWEGIKSMTDWLGNKIKGFFKGIVKGAKHVLKIHSPSKVFAEIGKYTAEGFGNGFENQMEDVRKQVQDAIPTTLDTTATINAGTDAIKAGNTITQYLTINTPKHLSPSETATLNENMLQRAAWGI